MNQAWRKPRIAVCIDEILRPLVFGTGGTDRDPLERLFRALKRGEADEIHFTLSDPSNLAPLKAVFDTAKKAELKTGLTTPPQLLERALQLSPDFLCIDFEGKNVRPKSTWSQKGRGYLKSRKRGKSVLSALSTDPKSFQNFVDQGFEFVSLPHSARGLRALCKTALRIGLKLNLCETPEAAAGPKVLRTIAAWEDASSVAIRVERIQIGSYFFSRALVTGYEAAVREAVSAICAP